MKRLSIVGVVLTLAALSVPATANVEFEDTALAAFGIDSQGVSVEGANDNAEFTEAWDLFINSTEGARILGKLDGNRNWEIKVRVLPGSEWKGGDADWGLSVLFKYPNDDGQQRVQVTIRANDTGGVANLADTIYHEFRHVENWVDDSSEEERDKLHAGTDTRMHIFTGEISTVAVEAPRIPETDTPIYDAVMLRNDDRILRYAALDIGDILTRDPQAPPPADDWPTSIMVEEFVVVDIDELLKIAIDSATENGEAIPDSSCEWYPGGVGCGLGDGWGAAVDDLLIGVRAGGTIPTQDADSSWQFWAGFESDGDPAHNASGLDDLYNGTDRGLRLFFNQDTGVWDLGVEQRETDGTVGEDSQSGAFGIVENDWAWFVIPSEELPFDDTRVRVALAGFDGSPITGITGCDVYGELPTDPLIGLDGSRVGGRVTGSAGTNDGGTVFAYGPTIVPYGGTLVTEFCFLQSDGSAMAGQDVAATLGDPPSSDTATHNSGTTDDSGCVKMPLEVKEAAGETSLHFFTGLEVVEVAPVTVGRGTEKAKIDLYLWMALLFHDIDTSSVRAGSGGSGHRHRSDRRPGQPVLWWQHRSAR